MRQGSRPSGAPPPTLADDGTVPADLLERVQRRLTADGDRLPTAAAVAAAVRAEIRGLVGDAAMVRLIRAIHHELVGAGPLTALLADPDTTDVVVNGPDDVRVDRGAGWEQASVTFADDAAVQRLARRLASAAGRRLDDAQPFVDAQLRAGVRLHAVLAPVAASGSCLSLRVLRPATFDLTELEHRGTFPAAVGGVLRRILSARLAFLVTGGTGSGKTTLLGAMLGAVDPTDRVVVVEDSAELAPAHPHTLRLVCRTGNVEGTGRIELRDLVRQALRMRPDRLVVGEVRGAELVDLLVALNTGHRGSAGTLHANSAADVPARLVALASLGGMPEPVLHAQLAPAVQVVVHVRREIRAGAVRRGISEIAVLRRGPTGAIEAVPAYDGAGAAGPGADRLEELLAGSDRC